jgi:SAM-dependent methyltransferase
MNLPIEFRRGDAQDLPFERGTFDGCVARFVLVHVAEPSRAIREMARVVRSSGRVVVRENDYDTLTIDGPDLDVTRKVLRARSDAFAHGTLGRQLPRLFAEAGLINITVNPVVILNRDFIATEEQLGMNFTTAAERAARAGDITVEESAAWLEYVRETSRAGQYLQTVTSFIVRGEKPMTM